VARDRRGGERRIELTIDATSVNTGNDKRDEHLRSGDFFDTEHHPTVRFVSTSVSDPVGGRVNVQGELLAAGAAWCSNSSPRSGNTRTGCR
jgi:polyisoprenoid-binding protein YceI